MTDEARMPTAEGGALATPLAGRSPLPAVPDWATFSQAVVAQGTHARSVKRLHGLLSALDPRAELFEREERLVSISRWLRNGGDPPAMPWDSPNEKGPIRRLRFLCHVLRVSPPIRELLSRLLRSVLGELSGQGLFAKLGIPGDGGLLSETIDRLSRRLMPQPIDEQDLIQLVDRMFPSRSDWLWLASVPPELVVSFVELTRTPDLDGSPMSVRPPAPSAADLPLGALPTLPDPRASLPVISRRDSAYLPLRVAVLEATLLLASRVSAAGLSDVIRSRTKLKSLQASPFFRLPRVIDALLATPRYDAEEIAVWVEEIRTLVDECHEAKRVVQSQLEASGVSVDVVYRIELIERSLERIEVLLGVVVPVAQADLAARSVGLLMRLLEARRRDLSLVDIVRSNTHMLARKIIERAGQTGEHYITVTKGEFVRMFFSAAGGGVLTAGTTLLKGLISGLHRPPFQEGMLAAANYAGSFTVMQLAGFTLATKQPSMTAAALAGALTNHGHDHSQVVTTAARLVRSQIAAALGNILFVIPASIAVDAVWISRTGAHVLTQEYAQKTLSSFHPTTSGTLFFAAFTGVILWLSSLAAGWVENWAVYRRLPEAIEEHRLRRFVGRRVMGALGRFFGRNVGGFGGNVAIGLMLGLAPIFGAFIGIPIEVRHVTLSTGSLTLAVRSLGLESLGSTEVRAAALGILCILAFNLLVSFGLAFAVASRAREVSVLQAFRLTVYVFLGFVRSPFRFFLPVGEATGAAKPKPHH
jgi:site-specific recombinase